MDPLRENAAATGLRITYAIIATVLIMIFTFNVAAWGTLGNKNFWHNFFSSEEVRDLAIEELDLSFEDLFRSIDPNIDVDFDDDKITGDFVDLLLEDYVSIVMDGERFDEDKYRDFFDEYEEDLFGHTDLSNSEIRRLENEAVEGIEEKLDEARDEFEHSDSYEFLGDYNKFVENNFICMCVTGALIVLGFIIILVIHRNKFRPVRALGIAMTVAQSIDLVIWGLLVLMIQMVMEESRNGEGIVDLMISKITGYSVAIILGIIITLVLGIVLIVVGATGAKRQSMVVEDGNQWPE